MKHFTAAACAALISISGMSAHAAGGENKPVYDERGDIPVNTFGNCVRTKWDAANDPCAPPAPAPAPAPVVVAPPPAPVINREARTVYFEFNKSTLTPDATQKLDTLVGLIQKSDQIIGAGIAGFADRIGSDDYNLELSKKRAKSVYDYLSERVTINTQILDIRALGENAPITDCAKDLKRSKEISCLQQDRRVEVVFQYQK